jgi:hypothetical protein
MTCPSCGGPMSPWAKLTCYECRYGGPWPDRLWKRITVDEATGCWLWTGGQFLSGYGAVKYQGKTRRAHRVAWEVANERHIPDGLTLDHLCRVKLCINPEHLEPVTMRVNTLRGTSPVALNAAKKICPRGHPYLGDNLVVYSGHRRCRECSRAKEGRHAYYYYPATTPEQKAVAAAKMRAYRVHRKAIGRPLP